MMMRKKTDETGERRFSPYHRSLFLSSPGHVVRGTRSPPHWAGAIITLMELVLSTSIRDGASKRPLGSRILGRVSSRSRLMAGTAAVTAGLHSRPSVS